MKIIGPIEAASDRQLQEELEKRESSTGVGLSCLICGETGFKNLIGHVWRGHKLNSQQYRDETGYDGPMIDRQHARYMNTISNALWSDPEVRQNRIEGVKNSYTEELLAERSKTTKLNWDTGVKKAEDAASGPRSDMAKLHVDLRIRASFKCESCGVPEDEYLKENGRKLELHHLNYDRYLPTLEDVQLLCKQCHLGWHKDHKTKDHRFPKVARAVGGLLLSLGIDLKDENYIETPARVAQFLETHFISRDEFEENIEGFKKSVFPSDYEGMITQCPIDAFGMCPHHLLPVIYKVAVGYIPRANTIGLSKLSKIAELCLKPPMLQETATTFLADALQDVLETPDVVVVAGGKHMCMAVRGVKNEAVTVTSEVRGVFMSDPAVRSEFYSLSNARQAVLLW